MSSIIKWFYFPNQICWPGPSLAFSEAESKENMVNGTLCRSWLQYNLTFCLLQSRNQHMYGTMVIGQPYARADL
jgi:hypothetical protein